MIDTDIAGLLRLLTASQVEFIIVGGVAATIHGSAHVTYDLDVLYRRTPENIARLASALSSVSPYLRGAPPGLPFHLDAATIQRGLTLQTFSVSSRRCSRHEAAEKRLTIAPACRVSGRHRATRPPREKYVAESSRCQTGRVSLDDVVECARP